MFEIETNTQKTYKDARRIKDSSKKNHEQIVTHTHIREEIQQQQQKVGISEASIVANHTLENYCN